MESEFTTPGELLDLVREYNLERLGAKVTELAQAGEVIIEPIVRDENEVMVEEGAFKLPMGLDVVQVVDGEVKDTVRVESENMLWFEYGRFSNRDWQTEKREPVNLK